MVNKFNDVAKNLFNDFLIKEFKSSREFTMRYSLIYQYVRKDCLVSGFGVLFENAYFKELLSENQDKIKDRDKKELLYHDIHNFQMFLHYARLAGFKIAPCGDSEQMFPKGNTVEFIMSAYNLTYNSNCNVLKMIDDIYVDFNNDFDFCLFLLFLSSHLEFVI